MQASRSKGASSGPVRAGARRRSEGGAASCASAEAQAPGWATGGSTSTMRLAILRVRTGLTERPLGEGALRRGRVRPHLPRGRKRAAPRAQRSERAAGCRPRGHAAQPHRAPQASCSARRCPNSDQTASMQSGSVREPPNRDLEKERRLAKEMVSTPKLIFSPRKPASRLRRRKMPSGKAIENPAVQAPSDTHSLSWRSSRPSNGQYAKSQTGHRRPSLSNTAIISKTAAIKAEDQIPGMRKYPDARARRGHFRAGQFTLGSKTARGTSYACRGPNPAGREARASGQRPIPQQDERHAKAGSGQSRAGESERHL